MQIRAAHVMLGPGVLMQPALLQLAPCPSWTISLLICPAPPQNAPYHPPLPSPAPACLANAPFPGQDLVPTSQRTSLCWLAECQVATTGLYVTFVTLRSWAGAGSLRHLLFILYCSAWDIHLLGLIIASLLCETQIITFVSKPITTFELL